MLQLALVAQAPFRRFTSRMPSLFRVVGVFASMALIPGCSSWPGVSGKDPGPNAVASPPNAADVGMCSGTPIPCSQLDGQGCASSSGCTDIGSCSGTPSVAGEACGAELSNQRCLNVPGCFWSPNCTGTPLGTCSGVTKAQCLQAQGCVFTPATSSKDAGSSSKTCTSYASRCGSNSSCDCGYSCVTQCPSCASVCGVPCQSDLECVSAQGPMGPTPYCTNAMGTPSTLYPGVCSDSLAGH